MPLNHILILGAVLFSLGILAVITKRNAIVVLMGIELVFNAANLNLVAFSRHDPNLLQGQLFSLFIIVVAAAEAAIALAIVLKAWQLFKTSNLNQISTNKQ
ncbi:MAG: NADH-quinone oxidoreductase subunit NuoK [Hymenobacteraceae bacterium]|nr:NADH-quinone oxidoreductase subunit NuoK [Hymenobacteraceae bacterium]MDX5398073.1 NADH-quinone oxidoreductase subunit NuoK [Hymenobacteraceae bacterium]MDX5443647.1 NADH-quinone oxidoreductase subunit NuoK [Hymenobacteraceae bacterium]MDX5514144.1 NADH-quinone oxidoreductase subunit NuoK [Hymenobacteraceae bacterium]